MRSWIVAACVFVVSCKSVDVGRGEDPAQIAKAILGDKGTSSSVTALRATLADLDGTVTEAGKLGFKPSSTVDKRLGDLARKLDVNFALVARARPLATEAAAEIVTFYAGVSELRSMLDAHVKASIADDLVIAAAEKADAAAKIDQGTLAGLSRYAIVIDTKSGDVDSVGAKLVEVGPPYCGNNPKPTLTGTCPAGETPTAFGYRSDPSGLWAKADLALDNTDSVPAKKIVMLQPSAIGDSLVKGANGVASELMYRSRLRAIADRVHGKAGTGGVMDDGGRLEVALQREASRPRL